MYCYNMANFLQNTFNSTRYLTLENFMFKV